MVDFKKRLKRKSATRKVDPLEIYESLDRSSETGPLRPSQQRVLSEWYQNRRSERNGIVKLHTGEGKTLIGLLLLLSKINSGEGPCLYVCPNIYLATQVHQEAIKFGIPTCKIGSDNDIPEEFITGSKILVVHVQKVFNGRTIFGLGNRSVKVGAVILDDSHACIDSIKNALTIKITREHPLYKIILSLFADDVREQGEGSFLEIESGEHNTMLPIPYWSWYEKTDEVTSALLSYRGDNEVKFAWPLLKDQLPNCQAFISGESLEISPSLIPIEKFGSFSGANNRILMSATTQDDSFFIKGLGFDIQSVATPLTNKELLWSGEKMILIPSLVNEILDRDTMINWMARTDSQRNFGVVSIIPSFSKKQQYEKIGARVAVTSDIFDVVTSLKDGQYSQVFVFVNRYDGIDLPDNACRILIIDSKPYFDSLLDRYEEDCRSDSDIVNVRIAQKVEQGLGRSVRGEKDYSVMLIVGGDLVKFVKSPISSKYFSSQTRKQIEIGIQVAAFANEESGKEEPYKVLVDLMNQALQRDEGWKEYYSEEMDGIHEEGPSNALNETLQLEYQAEYQFMMGEYDKAGTLMQQLCDRFGDDRGERGWYLQQLARYKYRTSKVESNLIQKSAFQNNLQLLKPKEGISYEKIEFIDQNRVKRIREWVERFSNYEELMISLDGILQNLTFGAQSEKFEAAIKDIGDAIGFLSQRPDKEIKKGPDNLWCGVENQYFMLECKNEVVETRSEISKHEAGQMNSHSAWFDSVYLNAKCKRILIIPTVKLSYHADFTHEVEVMRKNTLRKLKDNVRGFFREFSKYILHEVSDSKIQQLIDAHKLDLRSLTTIYTEPYKQSKK